MYASIQLPVYKVLGSLQPSLPLPEVHAPGGPDDGATLVDDAGHGLPLGLHDVLPAVDQALVTFLDEVDLAAQVLAEPGKIF